MLVNDTVLPPGADPTNAMTGYGAQTGGVATSNVNPDFMSTLQSQMMAQSGMISSANTGIEAAIQGAIGKVAESTSKGTQAIESKYTREADYLNTSQQNQITAMRERGVGMNTSDIAYKALASEADKNLKDLEMRKNELILQNDAAGASKIADLMLQTSKMKVDAMQQTFQNILAMGSFGLQAQAEKRAQATQSFQEKIGEANVGLQFGVSRNPNESWDSYMKRVGAGASAKQQAELAKINADIRLTNAKIQEAKAGKYDINNPADLKVLRYLAVNDPALYKQMIGKDKELAKALPDLNGESGAVSMEAKRIEYNTYERLKRGDSFETIVSEQSAVLDMESAMKAALKAKEKYNSEIIKKSPQKSTLVGSLHELGTSVLGAEASAIDYVFGSNYANKFK